MLGIGETIDELFDVLADLRASVATSSRWVSIWRRR